MAVRKGGSPPLSRLDQPDTDKVLLSTFSVSVLLDEYESERG